MSVICNTLVGPSVMTLTESSPEPGRILCLDTIISTGTSLDFMTGGDGPSTTSPPLKKGVKNTAKHYNWQNKIQVDKNQPFGKWLN